MQIAYKPARRIYGKTKGKIQTQSKVPPIDFHAKTGLAVEYSISGNMTQTGTPTPDAPIMPEECGDRTENLFDKDSTNTDNGYLASRYISYNGVIGNSSNHNVSEYINIPNNTEYITLSETQEASSIYAAFYDSEKNVLSSFSYATMPRTVSVPSGAKYIRLTIPKSSSYNTMLNSGSTALPYEPFGYKITLNL